jgi:hypothetical protein
MLNRLAESTGIPVKANIRLGTRVNGKLQNEAYFVLAEAPEVKAVYGDQPEYLEVMFPGDDLDAVAPANLEWWSGTRDKDGNMIGGDLVCSGNGPFADGSPGVAVWKDRTRLPPAEECASERDPKTGFVQRYCRGEQCSDWLDAKGFPRCKQTMRLYFILPRVSPTNVYRITTHSWNTMFEYHRLLKWVQQTEGLAFKPFKIFKEAKSVKHWDSGKGREFSRAMPILRIEKDEMFMGLYGDTIKEQLKLLRDSRFFLVAPPEPEPMLLEGEGTIDMEETQAVALSPAQRADVVLQDPEVQEGFDKLEAIMGKTFPSAEARTKARHVYILQKESLAGNVRDNVIDGLTKSFLFVAGKIQEQADREKAQESLTLGAAPDPVMSGAVPPPEEDVPVTQEVLENLDPLPSVEG